MKVKAWMPVLVLAIVGVVSAKVAGLPEKYQGYTGWTRANVAKITAAGAHPSAKDVYVNLTADKLVGTDDKYKAPFAAGTVFIKERMDPDTLSVTTLYVMEKKSAREGDWEWSVFERDGNGFKGGVFANAAMCIGCHQEAKASDLIFTQFGKR
ncbi:MAG: hypothetical protein C4333_09490 [Meiothermus sp.]